jgi:hypothetical protein
MSWTYSCEGGLLHAQAQTQRPHVRPHLLDAGQALLTGALGTLGTPAVRQFALQPPDGVLLLVVEDDAVEGVVGEFFGYEMLLGIFRKGIPGNAQPLSYIASIPRG